MQYIWNVALFAAVIAMVTCQSQTNYGADPGGLAPVEGQSNVQGVNTGGRTSKGGAGGGGSSNYAGQTSPGSSSSGMQRSASINQLQQMMMVPPQYPPAGNQGGGMMNLFGGSSGGGGSGMMPWFMFGDMMQDPLMCRMMGQPLSSCLMGNMLFN